MVCKPAIMRYFFLPRKKNASSQVMGCTVGFQKNFGSNTGFYNLGRESKWSCLLFERVHVSRGLRKTKLVGRLSSFYVVICLPQVGS